MKKELTLKGLLGWLDACISGYVYARNKDPLEAWKNCTKGDWMMWLAQSRRVDLKILTLAKVRHARLAEHLIKNKDVIHALDVAERFANNKGTRKELDSAAASVKAVAASVKAVAASAIAVADSGNYHLEAIVYAIDAIAIATDTDADADAVATAIANAIASSHAVAYGYYDDNDREEILAKCADICRETIPFELLDLEHYC